MTERIDPELLALTCEWCRFGQHALCVRVIVITGGRLEGVHYCACPSTGHPIVTPQQKESTA